MSKCLEELLNMRLEVLLLLLLLLDMRLQVVLNQEARVNGLQEDAAIQVHGMVHTFEWCTAMVDVNRNSHRVYGWLV